MGKILIVDARFYDDVADMLVAGAVAEIEAAGYQYDRVSVPGAFEVPAAISFAAQRGGYSGYVALGCVIRGETTHYDYVCMESARGLNQLAVEQKLAIGYGILTVESREQALRRADVSAGNKGGVAARACLDMIRLKEQFGTQMVNNEL